MQWLAVHLPQLSLEAFAASLPGDAAVQPLALLDAQRIVAANEAARARGVEPGLQRATALALAPELRLGHACARRDAQALAAVAHAALAFTPSVALDAVGALVLLEVGASLRLFGGLPRLVRRLRQALAPLGHRVQVAAAPTAAGAGLLARWRDDLAQGPHVHDMGALCELLDAAPLALLGAARGHAATLHDMGLATLADLRALPRTGLSRRFGEVLLDEVDRARGARPDPREWVTLPPRFDARLELAARADSSDQLLHAADVLLARLVAWAQAQHARVAGFTLCMQHEPRHRDRAQPAHTALDVALATPGADAGHLRTLLREHLARTLLVAPTLELRLHCRRLAPGMPPSGELFPTCAGEREGLVRLLERLRARLGDEGVQRLDAVADHRPEHATRALATLADTAAPAVVPALHRPSWLCPEPLPLPERGGVPWLDGAPLQLLAGPERIEAGWWEQGTPVARDCFVAQTTDGMLVWICRPRLPLAAGEGGGWRLHGRFG